ncbi:MAG: hypothetical protein AAF574_03310 [Pseudomonadota bacterium]
MRKTGTIVIALAALAGCASRGPNTDFLAINYQRTAQLEGPDRNPVLVIPGLLGSTLRDTRTNEFVWGGFDDVSVNPNQPEGLRALALPASPSLDGRVSDDDGVEPTWVLARARVKVLGLPFNLNVYAGILQALGAGGYRDESLGTAGAIDYGPDHFTCFQYPYDWRRDIVESAQRLHDYIADKRAYVKGEYATRFGIEDADVRFDIVAHSMGGLVARYFLMYGDADLPADGSLPELTWAGARFVDRVILVGTPNAGSALSFRNLVNGWSLGFLQPTYTAGLLGTYPSVYQLMPRNAATPVVWRDTGEPVGDLYAPSLWQAQGWGLSSAQADAELRLLLPGVTDSGQRAAIGREMQARLLRRAKQFHRAIDREAPLPEDLSLMLVVGDDRSTAAVIGAPRGGGKVSIVATGDGDGTVLRSSVLHDQRRADDWRPTLRSPLDYDTALFLPETHTHLTDSPTFTDNILHWLLEDPRD